jgi:hypothetical protein
MNVDLWADPNSSLGLGHGRLITVTNVHLLMHASPQPFVRIANCIFVESV